VKFRAQQLNQLIRVETLKVVRHFQLPDAYWQPMS
jgi:hypothetical protein